MVDKTAYVMKISTLLKLPCGVKFLRIKIFAVIIFAVLKSTFWLANRTIFTSRKYLPQIFLSATFLPMTVLIWLKHVTYLKWRLKLLTWLNWNTQSKYLFNLSKLKKKDSFLTVDNSTIGHFKIYKPVVKTFKRFLQQGKFALLWSS
jgi:hypothetical protein